MSEVELRPFAEPVEVRSVEGKLILSGTAIRYGARSRDLGGFRERVMPGAATEAIQKGNVLALEEHRSERLLGSTAAKTLLLTDTPTELRYEVSLPDTSVGREVAHLAGRGEYQGSSFGFRAQADKVKWTKDDDGTPLRSIHGFSLVRDVGPTVTPAYPATTAEMVLRSFPAEADLDVEVRSVLAAAASGQLASLMDEARAAADVVLDDVDTAFLKSMIAHHGSAVEMSTKYLAESGVRAPRVADLARNIVRAQKVEIDSMNGWLAAAGVKATPKSTPMAMRSTRRPAAWFV